MHKPDSKLPIVVTLARAVFFTSLATDFVIQFSWKVQKVMSTSRIVIISQLCLFGGLLLCIIIRPAGLLANNGISYYGIFKDTILPYVITLLGPAIACFLLAEHFGHNQLLKYGLIISGIAAIGLMLTPYSFSHLFGDLHDSFGSTLFVTQLIIGGWLVHRWHFAYWTLLLLLIQLLAGVAAFIFLAPKHGYMIEAQIVFQLAFGQLLYWVRPEPHEHDFNKPSTLIPHRT